MRSIKFEPLLIGKVSEYIEKKIKKAILDGKLKSGDRLPSEREMAEQFSVSLGSVREALKALQVLGLIEKKKGRLGGIFVSEINSQAVKKSLGHFLVFKNLSVKNVYDVRKIIEPQAMKMALDNITPDVIKKLEENVLSFEEKAKQTGANLTEREFFDLDKKNLEFHKIIIETTNNPILILVFDYICDLIASGAPKIMKPDVRFINDAVSEHRKLLEYIKQKDVKKCEEEIVLHLKKLDEYLVNIEEKFLREMP
jgi:DNA-binding FadR family transcriptional regulator